MLNTIVVRPSKIFTVRSIAFFIGAASATKVFKVLNPLIGLTISTWGLAACLIVIPLIEKFWLLCIMVLIPGICAGFIDAGAQVTHVQKKSLLHINRKQTSSRFCSSNRHILYFSLNNLENLTIRHISLCNNKVLPLTTYHRYAYGGKLACEKLRYEFYDLKLVRAVKYSTF